MIPEAVIERATMTRTRLVLLLAALALATGCAGALDRLRSPDVRDQLKGLEKLKDEKDPAVHAEAVPLLFALLTGAPHEPRSGALEALLRVKTRDGRTGLELSAASNEACGKLSGALMASWADFTPAQRERVLDFLLEQTCVDADEWLKPHLVEPAMVEGRLRAVDTLGAVAKVFDLTPDASFEKLPSDLRHYANALYVLWMADFYLTGQVGEKLGDYGKVLGQVDAARRDLSAALAAKARGEQGAEEQVKARTQQLNSIMARLVELEPAVKPRLEPIKAETQGFLLHAAAQRAAIGDGKLRERLNQGFLNPAQLKSATFILQWVEDLSSELASGTRRSPDSVMAPGKIRL
jgi:hypothetical protein